MTNTIPLPDYEHSFGTGCLVYQGNLLSQTLIVNTCAKLLQLEYILDSLLK